MQVLVRTHGAQVGTRPTWTKHRGRLSPGFAIHLGSRGRERRERGRGQGGGRERGRESYAGYSGRALMLCARAR